MILCQILQLPQTLGPYTVCLSFHPWVREIQKTLTQQWFQCVFFLLGGSMISSETSAQNLVNQMLIKQQVSSHVNFI